MVFLTAVDYKTLAGPVAARASARTAQTAAARALDAVGNTVSNTIGKGLQRARDALTPPAPTAETPHATGEPAHLSGLPSCPDEEDAFGVYLTTSVYPSLLCLVATVSAGPSRPWAGETGDGLMVSADPARGNRLRGRALSLLHRAGRDVDVDERVAQCYLKSYTVYLSRIVRDLLAIRRRALERCAFLDDRDATARRERKLAGENALMGIDGSNVARTEAYIIMQEEEEVDERRLAARRKREEEAFAGENPLPEYGPAPRRPATCAIPEVHRWLQAERLTIQCECLRLLGV